MASPDIFNAVSQPKWPSDELNSTIKSAANSKTVTATTRYMRAFCRMVATAPEKSMNAKIRSNPIRPGRDRRIMGTKIVMSTKHARKKLSPRSATQKGNSGASDGLDI